MGGLLCDRRLGERKHQRDKNINRLHQTLPFIPDYWITRFGISAYIYLVDLGAQDILKKGPVRSNSGVKMMTQEQELYRDIPFHQQ